ncbi:hypothetical protein FRC07_013976 [Ceratobasidium sp. 392]|nr:hypothetical protein FRC07_013976 [Ceratobasidium sp. 392]
MASSKGKGKARADNQDEEDNTLSDDNRRQKRDRAVSDAQAKKRRKKQRELKRKKRRWACDTTSDEDDTTSGSDCTSDKDLQESRREARLRREKEAMAAELADICAQVHELAEREAAGSNVGASGSGTQHDNAPGDCDPIPMPERKANATICNLSTRANLDLKLPWKHQDKSKLALLYDAVPELDQFINNWGAEYLVQEIFNHRRSHMLARERRLLHKGATDVPTLGAAALTACAAAVASAHAVANVPACAVPVALAPAATVALAVLAALALAISKIMISLLLLYRPL